MPGGSSYLMRGANRLSFDRIISIENYFPMFYIQVNTNRHRRIGTWVGNEFHCVCYRGIEYRTEQDMYRLMNILEKEKIEKMLEGM